MNADGTRLSREQAIELGCKVLGLPSFSEVAQKAGMSRQHLYRLVKDAKEKALDSEQSQGETPTPDTDADAPHSTSGAMPSATAGDNT